MGKLESREDKGSLAATTSIHKTKNNPTKTIVWFNRIPLIY